MSNVIRHAPPPHPPETFDILGLTRTQLLAIAKLVGNFDFEDDTELYQQMYGALKLEHADYLLEANAAHPKIVRDLKLLSEARRKALAP